MATRPLPAPSPLPSTPRRRRSAPALIHFLRPEPPPLAEVQAYYAMAEESGWYANGGPCATLLATRMRAELGGEAACLPVASGTAGLMAALRAAFGPVRGRRRIVVTPAFTFTATACAIAWAGFEPMFVDIDGHALQMDPAALEEALARGGERVAGVLGCSTFGCAPPVAVRRLWRELCAAHRVPLVMDSAAGFGSLDEDGRPLGSQGETEAFSFHATKPFAIGEGGMVASGDEEVAGRLSRLVNFGLDPDRRVSVGVGLNAKLSELGAAAGLAMLDRYPATLERRRATAARLVAALEDAPVVTQAGAERSTRQFLQLLVQTPAMRRACLAVAERLDVEMRCYFDPPLNRHPAFVGCLGADRLPVTDEVAGRCLSLPMANHLDEAEIARIAAVVRAAAPRPRRTTC